MIRTVWAYLNLLVGTFLIASTVALAALVGVRRARFYDWATRSWARWTLWASATPVRIEGLEHIELDEPQIFASNHVSWYDVFALAAVIPKRYRFIAKEELARIPIFGTAWKAAGHVSVDRSDRSSAIRSLEEAGRLLHEDNSSVVIFPEGTRSPTGQLLPFKKGAFMLALHADVDIVPVAVLGSRQVQPKDRWRIRSGPIIVRFGEPVRISEYSVERRDDLVAEVRDRVAGLLESPEPALRTR